MSKVNNLHTLWNSITAYLLDSPRFLIPRTNLTPQERGTTMYNIHYIHTYTHTYYIHTYILHTYIHTCIHTCIHAYIHTYIHTYMLHTYIHTYIHAYIHTCIHTYMHTYIHMYVYTYMHTYTSTTVFSYSRAIWHGCYCTAQGLCGILATMMCFNQN